MERLELKKYIKKAIVKNDFKNAVKVAIQVFHDGNYYKNKTHKLEVLPTKHNTTTLFYDNEIILIHYIGSKHYISSDVIKVSIGKQFTKNKNLIIKLLNMKNIKRSYTKWNINGVATNGAKAWFINESKEPWDGYPITVDNNSKK